MANVTISPNMSLSVPVVSVDPGPDWANNINSCLSTIDQHNHAPGSGVLISQSGIGLVPASTTFDSLNFNASNAFGLRSTRFSAQASPLALATDIGCLYESGVDLYYNDGAGNQIRLTSGGSPAGGAGTITGLPSGTASAAFSSGTFIFQSATSTAANIDAGSYIFRNASALSKGLTLSPPNAMAANYQLFLPAIPGVTSIMTLDTSGNIAANYTVDGSTITVTSNVIGVPNGGITRPKLVAVGQVISNSCNVFTTSSVVFVPVTSLSLSLTTTGRPVMVFMQSDGSGGRASMTGASPGDGMAIRILRGATEIANYVFKAALGSNVPNSPVQIICLDTPTAGTYSYVIQVLSLTGASVQVQNFVLVAYEL